MESAMQNQENDIASHILDGVTNSTMDECISSAENNVSRTNSENCVSNLVELKKICNPKNENSNSLETAVEKINQKESNTETSVLSVHPSSSGKKTNKSPVVTENQERINFLFQASNYLNNIENAEKFKNVSASLGSMAMAIGRKCVLRCSPSFKRQLCKGCGSSILPAISSKYRLRNSRQKHLVVTCNKCRTIKRFVTNPEFVLWSDRPEANVE